MKAVWTYWSKPARTSMYSPWCSEKDQWLAWSLSFLTARKHYPDTMLVTDRLGKEVLVDRLGLEFGEVSTELESLQDADPRWWGMGKLRAYQLQTAPFIHIDYDVFLWNRLPAVMEHAQVFAQSPERVSDYRCYEPDRIGHLIKSGGGWLPDEWSWYLKQPSQTAVNCGILGGRDVEFLKYYSKVGLQTAFCYENASILNSEGNDIVRHSILVEQYIISACFEYRQLTRRRKSYIEYMFPLADMFHAGSIGYTHLIAGAKRNRKVLSRLECYLKEAYPEYYKRCLDPKVSLAEM